MRWERPRTAIHREWLRQLVHDWFIEGGVPGRSHGLRKAGASRLAELGCSEHEVMAITDPTTSKEVTPYAKAARQVPATSAMARLKPSSEAAVTFPPTDSPVPVGKKRGANALKNNEEAKLNGAQGRDRTTDTAIFSRMLYQLSYLGAAPKHVQGERRFIVRPKGPVQPPAGHSVA